jgi:hypothetical protein
MWLGKMTRHHVYYRAVANRRRAEARPMWSFACITEERRERLSHELDFASLAPRIAADIQNLIHKREKGSHAAKGSWRDKFRFDVTPATLDAFFNHPNGYRGQYWHGPAIGNAGILSLSAHSPRGYSKPCLNQNDAILARHRSRRHWRRSGLPKTKNRQIPISLFR